jgi:hypothetical protein
MTNHTDAHTDTPFIPAVSVHTDAPIIPFIPGVTNAVEHGDTHGDAP